MKVFVLISDAFQLVKEVKVRMADKLVVLGLYIYLFIYNIYIVWSFV